MGFCKEYYKLVDFLPKLRSVFMAVFTHTSRKRRNRQAKRFFLIGACVFLLLALLFCYLYFFTPAFKASGLAILTDIPSSTEVFATKNGLYYLRGTTLHHTDLSGTPLWQFPFSSSSASLAVSDSLICLYDSNSATVMSPTQELYFTVRPSEFKLLGAYCGTSSTVFLTEIEGNSQSQYMRVFNVNQLSTELDRSEVNQHKILDYGLIGENDNLWMMTLDTSGVSPISRLVMRSPSQKKDTGIVNISDQLISDVFFFSSETYYLLGTVNLSRYNQFHEKQQDILVYGQQCIDTAASANGNIFVFVPSSAGNTNYVARIVIDHVSAPGSDTLIQLPSDVHDILASPSTLYCFSNNTVYLYKLTGEFEQKIELDFSVDSVQKLSDSLALLSSGKSTYLFPLSK